MPTLQELIAQKDALDQQIQALQRSQRADAIGEVRALMSQYGLTVADLSDTGGRRSAGASAGSGKVAAKYRDAVSGQTWSGRGLKPKWLAAALAQGRVLEDFAISRP